LADLWYFIAPIASAGLFTWVSFLHAAHRLKISTSRRLAVVYDALDALLYVLITTTPSDGSADDAASLLDSLSSSESPSSVLSNGHPCPVWPNSGLISYDQPRVLAAVGTSSPSGPR
jgi:hypothetical protein